MKLMVDSMDILFALLAIATIVAGAFAFAYSWLKSKKHQVLCDLFYQRFNYLPAEILISKSGGIFFTFQKDIYFLRPLIFNKNNIFVKKMKSEHYDFISSLPKDLTGWVKIKFSLLLISALLLLADGIVYYMFVRVS